MVKYGKLKYLPPRFMTVSKCNPELFSSHSVILQVNTAIEQLLEIEQEKKEGVLSENSLAVGMARLGQPTQQVGIV